ncbi:response regulator [Massilia sp. TS11]|uniref:response regulator n=1 Tax=Massilia sp. TS11 TaxID=2908003 RepID=UPI001EDA41DA|nr:response regulator [Massilia sp. TS11]MCG2583728.1 response regulator [Massilia sp. TS11]
MMFARRPFRPWRLLAVRWAVLAMAVAGVTVYARHEYVVGAHNASLSEDTRVLARRIASESNEGTVMGAAILMGLVGESVKQSVAGNTEAPPALMGDFAGLINQFNALGVQLATGDGRLVASLDRNGEQPGLGANLSERPYWRRARDGQPNVYPSVSGPQGERALYVAAPVRSGASRKWPVTGVYALQVPATPIDRLLAQMTQPALVVSPDGLVFAANRRDWVLKLAAPLPPYRRAALAQERQFGALFDGGAPARLPFTLDQAWVHVDGRRHLLATAFLDWQDDAGLWRVAVLDDTANWEPWWDFLLWGGGAGGAVLLLGLAATARQRAFGTAQRLRNENARRLRQITNHLPVAVYQYRFDDEQLRFVFISPALQEITGLDPAQALLDARALLHLLDPDGSVNLLARLQQAAARQERVSLQLRYTHPLSGQTRWAEWTSAPQREHGAIVWNGYLADITTVQEAAQALSRAKQAAEDATRSKSMFLANMSHEIRTPMNAIIGLAHLALKTALDRQQHDYLAKIHAAGSSLLGIVNDILDFSKIEAGKLDLEHADFSIERLIDSVDTIVGHRVEEKGLELVFDIEPEVPYAVNGDALRCGQILINLVGNAVKFTEHGQIVVRIACGERRRDQVELLVEVADSGIGMSAQQCAHLFEAFTQADGSTTRKYGGTGLGLTISRRLVELMDGAISVESAPGAGSSFRFNLWLGLAEQPRRPRLPDALAGLRVLVVDDNAAARRALAHQLHSLGLPQPAIVLAESGQQALELVDNAALPFGLALIDVDMPGMDGLFLAHALLARPAPPPMLLVSGRDDDSLRGAAAGMNLEGVLVKPVGASALAAALAQLAGDQASAPTPAPAPLPLRLDGLRVLLAEDNSVNQLIATELLEDAGASVAVAASGAEAVRMVAESDYHLVLMDLQMPELDGYAATRAIRARLDAKRLPIIALTAHALPEERERCLQEGMNDHIAKPIDPPTLYAALARWGARHILARPTPAAPEAAQPGFPPIAGLDVEAGLRRAGKQPDRYWRLLREFAATQADSGARLQALASGGDLAALRAAAHAAKGVAANVGALELAAVAGAIEQAGQAGAGLLAAYAGQLARLLAAIEAALPAASDDADAAPASADQLAALRALLVADDSRAEAMFAEQRAGLRAALGAAADTVEQAIAGFDYASALAALDQAGH